LKGRSGLDNFIPTTYKPKACASLQKYLMILLFLITEQVIH
jgi:hypothetical protein